MTKRWFSAIAPAALSLVLASPGAGSAGDGCDSCGGGCAGGKCGHGLLHGGGWGAGHAGVGPSYITAYSYNVNFGAVSYYGPQPWPFIWDWTFVDAYPYYYNAPSNYALMPGPGGAMPVGGFLPGPPGVLPPPGKGPLPPGVKPPEQLPPPIKDKPGDKTGLLDGLK